VGDLVYEEPYKSSNRLLNHALGGWVLGAKTYWRTGEPFTIYNGTLANYGYTNLGTTFMAQKAPGVTKIKNTSASNSHGGAIGSVLGLCTQFVGFNQSCAADKTAIQTTFGDVRRNSLYGPHYVNSDLSVLKKIVKTEGFTISIGANAYNAFNKANFANPNSTLGSASFGLITGVVAPPTSPYGSFQGAAVTQRVLQVHGKITF
jgi:hypothetical protein